PRQLPLHSNDSYSSEVLDIYEVLKIAIGAFDKETIKSAVNNSYKTAKVSW
ncbi:4226_t:CDS:1, partial [Gigaspora rosea]